MVPKKNEMVILRRTERSMEIAICRVQLMDRKRYADLIFVLGLKETMYHSTMANSVRWYGIVMRREDGESLLNVSYYQTIHKF